MTRNISELLGLATQANSLTSRVTQESKKYRLLGQLANDPYNFNALARTTVKEAKGGVLAEYLKTGSGLLLLHFAMLSVSNLCLENLLNKHPDLVRQMWDVGGSQLESIWQDEVRTIIKECHQEWILTVDAAEYRKRLVDAGARDIDVEELADWVATMRCDTGEKRG